MTKSITITNEAFADAVRKNVAAMQEAHAQGLLGISLPSIDVNSIISQGLCGLYKAGRPYIKDAVQGLPFIGRLAFHVFEDTLVKNFCPDIFANDTAGSSAASSIAPASPATDQSDSVSQSDSVDQSSAPAPSFHNEPGKKS